MPFSALIPAAVGKEPGLTPHACEWQKIELVAIVRSENIYSGLKQELRKHQKKL